MITVTLLASVVSYAAAASSPTGTFVHLFEWSWTDVAQECEEWLGPKGFSAVQVSPPMEHIQGDQWWTRYQPVSYNLTSRSGSEEEFEDMTKRCEAAGVQVIADAVVNHMAAAPTSTQYGIAGTPYNPGRQYAPYSFDPSKMHHTGDVTTNCAVTDYSDLSNVQLCDLVGLVDLDTENTDTQAVIAAYITKLNDAGAGGVRIDAAKHIDSGSLGAILDQTPSSLFVFQEVIYGAGEAVEPEMYTDNGHVTEFRFGTNLYANFNSQTTDKMQYMTTFGPSWGMIDSASAVVFTDNHDTQRSASNVLTYKDGQNYNMANYFMLAHPYGYPKVMSSYYFTNTDAGPPSTPVHSDLNVNCDDGSNWVCEHRRTGIAGMVGFRSTAAGENATDWTTDPENGNFVAFGRGEKAFIALNMDPNDQWDTTLSLSLPDGSYCNVIAADPEDCDGHQLTVSGGELSVTVPSLEAVAIHINAMLE